MKFSFNGKEYEVHFVYSQPDRTATVCQLLCGENELASAVSKRHREDQPFKEVGRQWAFWRMIEELPDKGLQELCGPAISAFYNAPKTKSKKSVRCAVADYIRGLKGMKNSGKSHWHPRGRTVVN